MTIPHILQSLLALCARSYLASFIFAALVFGILRLFFLLLRKIFKLTGLGFAVTAFSLYGGIMAFHRVSSYVLVKPLPIIIRSLGFVIGVYLAYSIVEQIFFVRGGARTGREMPRIVRDVLRLAVVVVASLIALKAFVGLEVTALVATSTVLSAVIGLAMQDTLANIFAGISLQLGKPFHVGDWVTVYNQTGAVVSTSWRATRIRTRDNNVIEIPNSSIAKAEIFNYSAPTPKHRRSVEVGIGFDVPPNQAKETLMTAASAVEGVWADPPPDVLLIKFGESAINYRLRYWVDDFQDAPEIDDRVMTSVWYYLKRAGVGLPYPYRNLLVRQEDPAGAARTREERRSQIRAFLGGVELLDALSAAETARLAETAEVRTYAVGEDIVSQGDAGSEFFIVEEGSVHTIVETPEGRCLTFGPFGRGFFFGEMSLLTGEPRSATVTALSDVSVLVITKERFADVLTSNPKVAEKLSASVAKRRAEVAQGNGEQGEAAAAGNYSRDNILRRIKDFFNIK